MAAEAIIQQAAAIPLRDGQVCLVRSGSGKQWIIPKGHIEADEAPEETALREAWEEGGLVGSIEPEPLGHYYYEKCSRTYRVAVFVMQVHAAADHWPECGRRPRRWLPPLQALAAVRSLRLQELLAKVLTAPHDEPATAALCC